MEPYRSQGAVSALDLLSIRHGCVTCTRHLKPAAILSHQRKNVLICRCPNEHCKILSLVAAYYHFIRQWDVRKTPQHVVAQVAVRFRSWNIYALTVEAAAVSMQSNVRPRAARQPVWLSRLSRIGYYICSKTPNLVMSSTAR